MMKYRTTSSDKLAIKFYTEKFPEVWSVYCAGCKELVAIRVLGAVGEDLVRHPTGHTVVPMGGKLLSSRARHDVISGQRQMGYSCACGNNSIISPQEEEAYLLATGKGSGTFDLLPHEEAHYYTHLSRILGEQEPWKHGQFEEVREK